MKIVNLMIINRGGSRLLFENGIFKVGPESVGAHPGPVWNLYN